MSRPCTTQFRQKLKVIRHHNGVMRFICRWSGARMLLPSVRLHVKLLPHLQLLQQNSTPIYAHRKWCIFFCVFVLCFAKINQTTITSLRVGLSVWYIIPLPCRARARSIKWFVCIAYAANAPGKGKYKMGSNESLVLVQGWFLVDYVVGAVDDTYNIWLDWTMCKRTTQCGVCLW